MIRGSEPVGDGSVFWVSGGRRRARGGVGESRFHLAQEAIERIDACRHLGNLGEFGVAAAGRLARGLEGGAVDLTAHQWRVFFAEACQADGILRQRISDHGADHVALLHRVQRS